MLCLVVMVHTMTTLLDCDERDLDVSDFFSLHLLWHRSCLETSDQSADQALHQGVVSLALWCLACACLLWTLQVPAEWACGVTPVLETHPVEHVPTKNRYRHAAIIPV